MSVKPPQNLSYLLHLWQVERDGEPVWWASLENPRTGERQAFADLAEMFAFLDEKTVNWLQPAGEGAQESRAEPASGLVPPAGNPHSYYLSYLLRLLCTESEGSQVWRVSLQSPHTTDRMNFADLEALIRYLEEKLREENV
jgi:hypothetical protein